MCVFVSFKVAPTSLTFNNYLSLAMYVRASGDRQTLIISLPTINRFVTYIVDALCLMWSTISNFIYSSSWIWIYNSTGEVTLVQKIITLQLN